MLRYSLTANSATALAGLLTTECREVFLQARSRDSTVTMLDQLCLQLLSTTETGTSTTEGDFREDGPPHPPPRRNLAAGLWEERALLQPVPCEGTQLIPTRQMFLTARRTLLSPVATQHLAE